MKKKLHLNFAQKFFNTSSKLNDNMSLSKLGNWDSLKQIELVMLLEKRIKRKLKSKEILKIKKIKDLSRYFI
tara:strand:- start:136 stop:351 length:216 start_codon:yes stop_codon:yes gene_type:complete